MIKKISATLLVIFASSILLTTVIPTTALASGNICSAHFLTFRAWYNGLPCDADGNIIFSGQQTEEELQQRITTIVFNIIFNIVQLVAYTTVGFIIYGGFTYVTSRGNPDGIAKGKKTITNAVIGLILAILSAAIVNTVQGVVGRAGYHDGEMAAGHPLVGSILNFIYFSIGLASVVVLVYAGFLYITAAGNPEKLTKAKSTILYAVVGMIVALAAFAITTFVIQGME